MSNARRARLAEFHLFGRELASYTRAARRAPQIARHVARAVERFHDPAPLLLAYLRGRPLASREVRMRDGTRIRLSSSSSDVSTLFCVLIKDDYGPLPRGGTYVDVGANIGAFSLLAARAGAERVIAFEPSREAFARLADNVRANNLDRVVEPMRLAVSDTSGELVRFPVAANSSNAIVRGDAVGDYDLVTTTTLGAALEERRIDRVEMLKLDCEGEEYAIAFDTPADVWRRVARVRLEYHDGRGKELADHLRGFGFRVLIVDEYVVGGRRQGLIWADR